MKRQMLLFAILGSIIAFMNIPVHQVDPKLISYEQDYLGNIDLICPNGIRVRERPQRIIQFGHLPGSEIGLCAESLFRATITFDQAYWDAAAAADRLSLFAHEEGHCVLGLDHSTDPHNYMYFQMNYLTKEQLEQQVNNDIKEKCL